MAQYDGSIRINTQIDTRGFERDSRSLISGVERLRDSINRIMGPLGLAIGIAGLVALGRRAIKTSSDIQEVQNVVDVAFGKMSYKMEEFAKTSVKQFGLSQLSAKEMGSTFMAMASNMVGSAETASDMAINLTKRAADMASFYNRSAEDTATALHGVFTGETEVLKQYGIVQTEVNLQEYAAAHGIKKKVSAMTQAEKVQLRYNYVMEQTSLAAGDFARTSGNWANQTRILAEQFKELLGILGSGLITVLNPVVKFLNTVLSMLIAIAQQTGALLTKLFGITVPVAQSGKIAENLSAAAGGADELAEGIKEAGKAAKKSLSPLDRLNVLSQDTGGKGSGAGAGGSFEMPELEMDETQVDEVDTMSSAIDNLLDRLKPLFDWFKKLKNLFAEGFFDGLGESWKDRIADIVESAKNIVKTLKEIFTDPGVVAAAKTMIEKITYALGQVVGSLVSIGITIAQNIVGGIDKYLEQNKEFLKQKLISIFDITGDIALLIGEAFKTFAYIFEAFGSESGQQLTANIIGIFNNTLLGLLELGLKFGRDILNCIIQPIADNKEALRTALEGFLGVLAEITGDIKARIEEAFKSLNQLYGENVKPFLDDMSKRFSEWIATDLINWIDDFGNSLKRTFDWILENEGVVVSLIVNVGLLTAAWKLLTAAFTAWNAVAPVVAKALTAINTLLTGGLLSGGGILSKLANTFALVAGGAGTLHEALVTIFGTMTTMFAGIASIIGGVVTAVTNFISMLQNGFNWINEILMAIGTALAAIGAVILGAPALVAGIVAAVVAAVATIVVVIHDNWDAICEWFSGVADWINENVIQPVIGFFRGVWDSVSGFFSDLWNDIVSIWSAVAGWFSSSVIEPVVNFFQGLWTRVKQIFEGLWIIIQAVWIVSSEWFNENVVTPIVGFFQGLWESVSGFFVSLWEDIATVWELVSGWFNENVIIPVTDFFKSVWDNVSGFFSNLWEDIQAVWGVVSGWFNDNIITPVQNAFEVACDAIGGFFSSLWAGIKGGVVTAMNAVIGRIESAINWIVDGINKIISGFNNIVSWASEVVGTSWGGVSLVPGVSFPRLTFESASPYSAIPQMAALSKMEFPGYATGQVIPTSMEKHLAWLGDNNRETEVVSPLSTIKQANKEAVLEVLSELGLSGNNRKSSGNETFVFQVDGDTFFEITRREAQKYFNRTGMSPYPI